MAAPSADLDRREPAVDLLHQDVLFADDDNVDRGTER